VDWSGHHGLDLMVPMSGGAWSVYHIGQAQDSLRVARARVRTRRDGDKLGRAVVKGRSKMYMFQRITLFLCMIGLGAGATGCLLAGNYHSAKTLEKGESSFGLTFSATTYEFTDGDTGDVTRVQIPSLIPEITYHVGLSDNLEVGGRVGLAQLALEADLKYRFYRSDKLHLAVAPSIGGQSFIVISGTMLRLPGIATYEISDNVAITGALFGSTTSFSAVNGSGDDGFGAFSGSLVSSGGAIGLEFSGETFSIRPGVEFTRYLASFNDEQFEPFNTINAMVHLSFIFGREKKQLDRIENKIDTMSSGGMR
jgi:hypothetical protein